MLVLGGWWGPRPRPLCGGGPLWGLILLILLVLGSFWGARGGLALASVLLAPFGADFARFLLVFWLSRQRRFISIGFQALLWLEKILQNRSRFMSIGFQAFISSSFFFAGEGFLFKSA